MDPHQTHVGQKGKVPSLHREQGTAQTEATSPWFSTSAYCSLGPKSYFLRVCMCVYAGCPVHFRIRTDVSGLQPLKVCDTYPVETTHNVSSHGQRSPGDTINPRWEPLL